MGTSLENGRTAWAKGEQRAWLGRKAEPVAKHDQQGNAGEPVWYKGRPAVVVRVEVVDGAQVTVLARLLRNGAVTVEKTNTRRAE